MNIQPTKSISREKLNDIGFRVILIPFFGIAIPLLTRLTQDIRPGLWNFKLSYLYTIGIAFIIWEGNRFLVFTLRTYFDWFNKPVKKILALLLVVPFFTVPVSVLLLTGWYHIFAGGLVNNQVVTLSTIIILVSVLFIVHVYETVFLVKEAETEKLKKEQLERAKAEAELEALKNQIDPHFIFNSLNVLSYLIEDAPEKAKQFNEALADVYRYILQNKARDLVMLREEIEFLYDYFSLHKIRFEKAVRLDMFVDEALLDAYLVPPISLQILMENAFKHNEFSDAAPLVITIQLVNDELVVRNEIRKKILRKPSSKIGLQNLGERYKLTTSKEITIEQHDNFFTVKLPVLKIV
ncbi:sensor histidine kinase [Foetidibacter luteolus]|uniref:sensor histidine kinase n=1 Tax=Foetidibacter luteolus TaxID=2608880 RepID=UPI001F331902|nr:histidine kinase [Foetidibacter luteolus]